MIVDSGINLSRINNLIRRYREEEEERIEKLAQMNNRISDNQYGERPIEVEPSKENTGIFYFLV